MENKKLEAGEKYLKGFLMLGELEVPFVAFPNYEATKENRQPNFRVKGGGGIWVNEKKRENVETEKIL